MSAFFDQASVVLVPSGYKSGVVYSQKPMTTDGQLTFTRASTATRVNASGLIEEVASGVPRLDYLGGTCPKLLLEPQRTNLFPYSEYMNGLVFTQATATDNAETSPEGVTNAARLYDNTVDAQHRVYENIAVTSGTTYTFSVFAKKGTLRYCYLLSTANGTERWFFDLQEGTAITSGGTIEDYGNGWYRLSIQVVPSSTGNSIFSFSLTNDDQDNTYIGTGTDYHIIYGFQLEAGSYPTSLIPTNGTSVTRVADNAIINPSSLVGATQGSWFFELDNLSFGVTGVSAPTNWIGFNVSNCLAIEARGSGETKNIYFVKEESNTVTTLSTKEISTTLKACFVWSGTSLKCFVDGAKVYDAAGFTQPSAWSTLEFNSSGREAQQTLKQTLLFSTAISDADAIALTA